MTKALFLLTSALVLLAVASLFIVSQLTPASAADDNAVMALKVPSGGTCEGPSDLPTSCTVPLNGTFTLAVNVLEVPTGGSEPGYIAFQSYVTFGDLDYQPADKAAYEITWPDSMWPVRAVGPDWVAHASMTNFIPPRPVSTFEGAIVELAFTCSAAHSQHEVQLVPYSEPPAATLGAGFMPPSVDPTVHVPAVPAKVPNSPLTINCGAQSETPIGTPTPPNETPTATPIHSDGTLGVDVTSGGVCDSPPDQATTCTVPLGGMFTLSVSVLELPAKGATTGYIAFETHVHFGGMTYEPTTDPNSEIIWPDLASSLRFTDSSSPFVVHDAFTSTGPPYPVSTFQGAIVELAFRCSATQSQQAIDVDGGFVRPEGTLAAPAILNSPLTIHCGGTPGAAAPVGDVDCSGSVDAVDAALILQKIAGIGGVPCAVSADANVDGYLDVIDAALILQFDAALIPRLPP